jgi:Tfp pilus assembly protein FimT
MVVIAIFALLSVIAVPNFMSWRTDANFRGAVNNLKSDLNLAKLNAARESALVVVDFYSDRYEIFLDNGANAGNWTRENDERYLKIRRFPSNISIDLSASNFTPGGVDRTRFNQRGLPDLTGTVVVTSNSGDSQNLNLNRLGRIDAP